MAVNPAAAQRLSSLQIDDSFVVTPFGPGDKAGGQQTYVMLALHKVVNFDGRTFVCGGLYGTALLNKKFIQQAQIIASDGTRIKQGLTRLSRLSQTNEQRAEVQRGVRPTGSLTDILMRPITPGANQFSGQEAKCIRSWKSWRAVFGDGKSVFTMPSRVLVRVPD
ncbi:hypothetical protein [Roseobacter weihaiensis]|uniref:hypothetical protein n=1 Tax=Roseobacter weihaiensis TaxID=2763262 RepID=UPI001D0A5948|nr:hypothetical protein [Roseobacter sp. H9]